MAAYIQGVIDNNGNNIYPKTKTQAVFDDKGVPLSEQHFVIKGPIEFSTINYTITDKRIKSDSLINIYYNDNYNMSPQYTVVDGSVSIVLDAFPSGVNKVIIDAVEVVNL